MQSDEVRGLPAPSLWVRQTLIRREALPHDRILQDIGVTRTGVREAVLAERNELDTRKSAA